MRARYFLLLLVAVNCWGQMITSSRDPKIATMLNFEANQSRAIPEGWNASVSGGVALDDAVVHGGKWSLRIERTATSAEKFTTTSASFALDATGERIELRGYIRMEEVSGFAALWIREDGVARSIEFDSTQKLQRNGTSDWTEHKVSVRLNPSAKTLWIGFLVSGTGRAWVDDLQLLVDGKPIWEAPKVETVLNRDTEFDAGSKIALTELTPVQVDNLATLGRVWGFLKYHHPKVTSGKLHWDYELFRVLPEVLAAPDRAAANAAMARWVDALGELDASQAGAKLPDDIHLKPDVDWLADVSLLGPELGGKLSAIYAQRPARTEQFYVGLTANVHNPQFSRELTYADTKFPDAGYQLLALFRYWNIIQYWFPYRDVIGEDWTAVLKDSIPRVALAADVTAYRKAMLAVTARIHDSHASFRSPVGVKPPGGGSQLPVTARFVDGEPVITSVLPWPDVPPSPLRPGDVVEKIDGEPLANLMAQWRPYYPASNEATVLRDMARTFTYGPAGEVKLTVRREGKQIELTDTRIGIRELEGKLSRTHDLPGEAFQMLSPDVAYLKLSAVGKVDLKSCIARAAGTKGLIVDIRNYPAAFVVFTLGPLLVDQPTEFARFTGGDLANPGAFSMGKPLKLTPDSPHYGGRVVILLDEVSQSNAEYTAMALRASPRAIVIGSTTAGADGNVSPIPLPGGLQTHISGIGVFFPDQRPTQRVGIVPDIEVKPTIEGIRTGRDEVLEEALRQILGPEVAATDIRKLIPAPNGASGATPGK
jgi:C-terminal processing protease CtpA/Prc